MKKRQLLLAGSVCWIGLVLLNGCTNVPFTHYYTFQPTIESARQTGARTYPVILGIETYEADIPYQQDKIVFRTSPYEVNFYEYHRWLRPPTELVTERIHKTIDAAKMFAQVYTSGYEAYADYVLRGKITMFDQWYAGKTSEVRLEIEHQLFDLKRNQILWTTVITTTSTTSSLEIVETVKGFEAALQDNIRQTLAALDLFLSQQP